MLRKLFKVIMPFAVESHDNMPPVLPSQRWIRAAESNPPPPPPPPHTHTHTDTHIHILVHFAKSTSLDVALFWFGPNVHYLIIQLTFYPVSVLTLWKLFLRRCRAQREYGPDWHSTILCLYTLQQNKNMCTVPGCYFISWFTQSLRLRFNIEMSFHR